MIFCFVTAKNLFLVILLPQAQKKLEIQYGTRNVLQRHGIPVGNHRARQMTYQDYKDFDLLIGMDSANIRNMTRIAGGDAENKIKKLLTFCGSSSDVADPWYTGDFDTTYRDVSEGCQALYNWILENKKLN